MRISIKEFQSKALQVFEALKIDSTLTCRELQKQFQLSPKSAVQLKREFLKRESKSDIPVYPDFVSHVKLIVQKLSKWKALQKNRLFQELVSLLSL